MNLKDYEYYRTDLGVLYCGDCLDILPLLKCGECNGDGEVSDYNGIDNNIQTCKLCKGTGKMNIDMILCDLPYGTTQCSWDIVIPFEPLWKEYKRLSNGAVVLTGSQPFTTDLINSNREWFKYDWIWEKSRPSKFLIKNQPNCVHEYISIFYNNLPIYNSQKFKVSDLFIDKRKNHNASQRKGGHQFDKNIVQDRKVDTGIREAQSVIFFKSEWYKDMHPTQKPVALFEYLIKTYTNKDMIVLDNCIGSGTTAVACEKLGRRWIGIEISEKYCEIAKQRIKDEADQLKLL